MSSVSLATQRALTNKGSQEKQLTHGATVVSQFDLNSQAGNQREEQIHKLVLTLLCTSSPWGTCPRVLRRKDLSSPAGSEKEVLTQVASMAWGQLKQRAERSI